MHAASFSYCLSLQLFAFFYIFLSEKVGVSSNPVVWVVCIHCFLTVQISSVKRPPVRVWRYSFCENFVSFIFLRKLSSHLHTFVIFFRRKTYLSTVRESIALLNTTGPCYIFPFLRKIISYFPSQIDEEKDNWNPFLNTVYYYYYYSTAQCTILAFMMQNYKYYYVIFFFIVNISEYFTTFYVQYLS